MIREQHLEDLVAKYVRNGDVVAVGTGRLGEAFLKKLAFEIEEKGLNVGVVPTSVRIASVSASLGMRIVSLNESEVDLAVEFADMVDENYNYIKRDSASLVRDKMIAQSASTLVIIAEGDDFAKKLSGKVPFEITTFGWKRTMLQLENLGRAKLREVKGRPYKTETNHYIIDVDMDPIHDLEDTEFQAKEVPGVLETGLFLGYADKVLLHNGKIRVKSRTEFR